MTLPISYFRFYFPEYMLKTRLPPNCATGFLDRLRGFALISESPVLYGRMLTGSYAAFAWPLPP